MVFVSVLVWATIGYAVYLIVKSVRARKQLQATTASGICPKCRSGVATGATKCSSCGSWVVPFTQTPLGKVVVVALVAVVALGGVALYVNRRNQKADELRKARNGAYCKNLRFLDPDRC